jgi:hypothetical protein
MDFVTSYQGAVEFPPTNWVCVLLALAILISYYPLSQLLGDRKRWWLRR